MSEPCPPSWKAATQKATGELDIEKLRHHVRAAETAIFFRLQELPVSVDQTEELEEISTALAELLELKIRKLGWPNSR
ncbi:MAG: hypothetical protein WA197_14755 [Candidatus Acidiferrales bacterium]